MTAADLAGHLKPAPARQTVIRWANGTRHPSVSYQQQLSEIFGGEIPVELWVDDDEAEQDSDKAVKETMERQDEKLSDVKHTYDDKITELLKQHQEETQQLRDESASASERHSEDIALLKKKHAAEFRSLRQEVEEQIQSIKQQTSTELHRSRLAHDAAVKHLQDVQEVRNMLERRIAEAHVKLRERQRVIADVRAEVEKISKSLDSVIASDAAAVTPDPAAGLDEDGGAAPAAALNSIKVGPEEAAPNSDEESAAEPHGANGATRRPRAKAPRRARANSSQDAGDEDHGGGSGDGREDQATPELGDRRGMVPQEQARPAPGPRPTSRATLPEHRRPAARGRTNDDGRKKTNGNHLRRGVAALRGGAASQGVAAGRVRNPRWGATGMAHVGGAPARAGEGADEDVQETDGSNGSEGGRRRATAKPPPSPPGTLPGHASCSPDSPLERIAQRHNGKSEVYEVVDAAGKVLHTLSNPMEAKNLLDSRELRGAVAVRCGKCLAQIACHTPQSPETTEHLAKLARRDHHPPQDEG